MGNFVNTHKNLPDAQKLSGWQCHPATHVFGPLLGGTESVKVVLKKKEKDLKPLLSLPTQGDWVRSVGQAGVLLCILNVGHLVEERNMKMLTTTKIQKYQRHQMYQQFDLSVWFPPPAG